MKNIQTNQLIIGITILALGFGLGYAVRGSQSTSTDSHQMGGGMMMGNHAMGGMQDAMGGMMMGLSGKTGDAFDSAFLSEMIMHHQGAVAMAEAVLKTSKRPELLQLAQDIITAQTKEIQMMNAWGKEWFK
jgi:uncharacterized protein (DUF305 family)